MIVAGNKAEKNIADYLMTADLDPLSSSLHIGAGGGLEKLLLEMVSCGRLQNEGEVMRFIACTLMSIQQGRTDVRLLLYKYWFISFYEQVTLIGAEVHARSAFISQERAVCSRSK